MIEKIIGVYSIINDLSSKYSLFKSLTEPYRKANGRKLTDPPWIIMKKKNQSIKRSPQTHGRTHIIHHIFYSIVNKNTMMMWRGLFI